MNPGEFYLRVAAIAGQASENYMASNPAWAGKDPKDPTRIAAAANAFDTIADNLVMVRLPALINGKSLSGPLPPEIKALLETPTASANLNIPPALASQLPTLLTQFADLQKLVQGLVQQPTPTPVPPGPVTVPTPAR